MASSTSSIAATGFWSAGLFQVPRSSFSLRSFCARLQFPVSSEPVHYTQKVSLCVERTVAPPVCAARIFARGAFCRLRCGV